MIFDCNNICNYKKYSVFRGPFIIIFYKKDKQNFKIYENLKNMKDIHDIPIIRFDWNIFKNYYKTKTNFSYNHLVIIGKSVQDIYVDGYDFDKVKETIQYVRRKRLENSHINNKQYQSKRKQTLRRYCPNGHSIKVSEFLKFEFQSAESLYSFPNMTSEISKLKFVHKKINKQKTNIVNDNETSILAKNQKFNKIKVSPKVTNLENIVKKLQCHISDLNKINYEISLTKTEIPTKLDKDIFKSEIGSEKRKKISTFPYQERNVNNKEDTPTLTGYKQYISKQLPIHLKHNQPASSQLLQYDAKYSELPDFDNSNQKCYKNYILKMSDCIDIPIDLSCHKTHHPVAGEVSNQQIHLDFGFKNTDTSKCTNLNKNQSDNTYSIRK